MSIYLKSLQYRTSFLNLVKCNSKRHSTADFKEHISCLQQLILVCYMKPQAESLVLCGILCRIDKRTQEAHLLLSANVSVMV